MKFTTRKDIEAPLDYVFRAASDFAAFERQALRRNIEVVRTTGAAPVGCGTAWSLKVPYRNRLWTIDAEVTGFDVPTGFVIHGAGEGVDIDMTVGLMALSRNTTRFEISVDLRPRTMTTRMVVQSLKLAKGRIQGKFDTRIATFASDLEDRYRATA
ncbi:SRPBCC family protein [Oceaniglobus ichthyenteri]|uniref:SRPBCC family protein n=1 Tax=Oceaniglobus ichthyenteri TaxID=2136177 RepID=UPI000D3830AB|nr:SRPBCC family protein [Oceaniglobus ichthyenteri]